jgi:hypothetical protein
MLPMQNGTAGLVLLQYVLMFLPESVTSHVLAEINRVCSVGSVLILELVEIVNKVRDVDLDQILVELNLRGCDGLVWEPIHMAQWQDRQKCVLRLERKA